MPEIKGSLKQDNLNIPSGYPSKRLIPSGSDQNIIQKKNKNSIVGSIKERIQNAIKQSQNDRYNRDAIDELGDMDIKIAQSNIKENNIPVLVPSEDKEDLQRGEIKFKPNIKDSLSEIDGDYNIKINDIQRKPRNKILTDEEKYSMDYMIVDKKNKKKNTGWSMQSNPMFDLASKLEQDNALYDQPNMLKPDYIDSERVRLPDPTIQELDLTRGLNIEENEEIKNKTQFLPTKVIPLDQKLVIPDYDTLNKLKKMQDQLSTEGISKRLYEDIDDYKDLREERAIRNSMTYGEAKKIRDGFVKGVTVK